MKPNLLFCAFFLLFYSNIFAQQHNVVISSLQQDEILLKNHAEIFADSSDALSFSEMPKMSFHPFRDRQFQNNINTYWLRVQIDNQDSKVSEWYISADGIDELVWYIPQKDGKYVQHYTGQTVSMDKRDVPNGKLAFVKVLLEPGQQTIYCQLKIQSLYAKGMCNQYIHRLAIYSSGLFKKKFQDAAIYHAIFLGALLIMVFYNLVIYLSLKDVSYLYYVIYAICFGWLAGHINGYTLEIFFYNNAYFFKQLGLPSMTILPMSYVLFARSFLQLNLQNPKWDKILLGAGILQMIFFPLYYIPGTWLYIYKTGFLITSFIVAGTMYVAIRSYLKGFKPALFFIIAEGLFFLSNILFTLYHLKIIPQIPATLFIEHGIFISFLVGLALYSLGLAARFNIIKKELAFSKLEKEHEKQRLIEEKNKELEEKVNERTIEITQQNEELQQQQEEITSQRDRIEEQNRALQEILEQLNSKNNLIKIKNEEITEANILLEKKIAERTNELNKAYKNLLETNNELDLFIYRSAHDLKGPIARLLGLCYLGKLELPDDIGQTYIGKLELSAKEMDHILSRLIHAYEIKKHEPQPESIHLKQIVCTIVKSYQEELNNKQIAITVKIADNLSFYVDKLLIETLLKNLIDNAITYHYSQKPDLFIKINIQNKGTNQLCVSIQDNGTGIDPAVQARIFEMFYRGSEVSQGTGLGLYEAQIITHKMHGTIQLKSSSAELTEFEVILPETHPSLIIP